MIRSPIALYFFLIFALSAQTQAPPPPDANVSAKKAQESASNAEKSAGDAAKQDQAATRSAQDAVKQDHAATGSAQDAAKQDQAATSSAQDAQRKDKIVRAILRRAGPQMARASNAFPVYIELDPPNPGNNLPLKITCVGLSKRDCERLAKPVAIYTCDSKLVPNQWGTDAATDSKYQGPPPLPRSCGMKDAREFPVPFVPPPATESAVTVKLVNALQPGTFVRVVYDENRHTTDWVPVLPADTQCCAANPLPSPTTVYAFAPFEGGVSHVYLVGKDSFGQPVRLAGILASKDDGKYAGWWKFQILDGSLAPGSAVSVIVPSVTGEDGKPLELAKGSLPNGGAGPGPSISGSGSKPAPQNPVPAATAPVVEGGSPIALAKTGDCVEPQIDSVAADGTKITVDFHCSFHESGVVVFADNKPQAVSWSPVPGSPPGKLTYTATFSAPLLPFQRVKVLQFYPPQRRPDAPEAGQQLVPDHTVNPLPDKPWWLPTPVAGNCAPPQIDPKPKAGDTSLTVEFGDSCKPERSNISIYVDNVKVEGTISLELVKFSPPTLKASFSTKLQLYQYVKVLYSGQNQRDSPAVYIDGTAIPQAQPPEPAPKMITTGPCADAYIENAPGLTDTISVILGCMPNDPNKDLHILVNGKPPDGTVIWSLTGSSPLTFTAKLTSNLKDGDSVQITENGQRDLYSPTQIAAGPPKPPSPDAIQLVQEGATSVTGTAKGLDTVRVRVVDGRNLLQQVDAPVSSTNNSFTASFTNPLQAEQEVHLFGVSKSGAESTTSTNLEIQPFGIDWGRVRGYFTAGVILSNNNSQLNLTNANTFADFNVDKQWFHPALPFSRAGSRFRDRFSFNTYFDARLTAIPTGTSGSASGSTPTLSSGTSGTPTASGGTTSSSSSSTTASTANPTASPTSLLSNNQAAELQVGAYIPFTVDQWDFREKHYSLFMAPIAKVGFYTLTEAGSSTNQAAENANRSTSTFFPFYSWGLRLGHRRDYDDDYGRTSRNRAPEQLSYLDVSVGKWSNFEYLQPYNFTTALQPTCTMPASDPTTAACDVRKRLWRYGFEGLLVIPNTPLIIGLSANVSAARPRGSAIYLAPPDDLRFLFGVRFDASKLTGILGKLGGQ